MKKLLKIVAYRWSSNESRDKRDLSAAREAGFDVAVMASGERGDRMRETEIEGYRAYLRDTKASGVAFLPKPLNKLFCGLQWAADARRYHADVLNCHDLYALIIGYIAARFQRKQNRPALLYDAHEFELGRNTNGKRGKFAGFLIRIAESFLMKRTALNVMVNDSIAEETARIHHLKEKPLVIRNIPGNWKLEEAAIDAQRWKFIEALSAPEDTFLLMYHGMMMPGRGIEKAIELLSLNPHVALVLLGNGEEEYVRSLHRLAEKTGSAGRILFRPAVPLETLWKYVGAADVGLLTTPNIYRSYYYMLPNKFFECIQALTPVIYPDFPEVSRLITRYGIGLTCDTSNLQDINEKVERMRTDRAFYQQCKENLVKAKRDLCWENEKKALVREYQRLYNAGKK